MTRTSRKPRRRRRRPPEETAASTLSEPGRVDRLLEKAILAIDCENLATADLQMRRLLAYPDPMIADTLELADRALGDQLLELAVEHLHAAQSILGAAT